MEDQGQHTLIGTYKTLTEANKVREKWTENGYFSERDFYTMETPNEAKNGV